MIHDTSLRSDRFGPVLRTPSISAADPDPIYQAGDTVMHPSEGVCTIEEILRMSFSGTEKRHYYILKPTTEKSSATVYMPVARGNAILRRLLTKEDILTHIHRSGEYAGLWIPDSKQRKEAFTRILSEGNYARIIRMIQELHEERLCRNREGKKLCAADEAILNEAEHLLHQEFSYVLHMTAEETAAFVCRELGV